MKRRGSISQPSPLGKLLRPVEALRNLRLTLFFCSFLFLTSLTNLCCSPSLSLLLTPCHTFFTSTHSWRPDRSQRERTSDSEAFKVRKTCPISLGRVEELSTVLHKVHFDDCKERRASLRCLKFGVFTTFCKEARGNEGCLSSLNLQQLFDSS